MIGFAAISQDFCVCGMMKLWACSLQVWMSSSNMLGQPASNELSDKAPCQLIPLAKPVDKTPCSVHLTSPQQMVMLRRSDNTA